MAMQRATIGCLHLLFSILHPQKLVGYFVVYYVQSQLSIEPYRLRCYFDQVVMPSAAYTSNSDTGRGVSEL